LGLRRSGCSVFCLFQAASAKKQENRPPKNNKENVLFRPVGTTTATKGLTMLVGANGSSFLLKLTPVSGQ